MKRYYAGWWQYQSIPPTISAPQKTLTLREYKYIQISYFATLQFTIDAGKTDWVSIFSFIYLIFISGSQPS